MYKLTETYEPYKIDEDQDMWVAELSYIPHRTKDDGMKHDGCIEVRADSEELLKQRIETVLTALNNA